MTIDLFDPNALVATTSSLTLTNEGDFLVEDLSLDQALKAARIALDREAPQRSEDRPEDIIASDLWASPKADRAFAPLLIGQSSSDTGMFSDGYEGQHAFVTGRRYVRGAGGFTLDRSGWNFGSEQTAPPEYEPTPPDLTCMDENALSPAELLDYRISQEAAKIAKEILAKPDHDVIEYGSMIYMDANGIITHTPITAGGPTWAGMDMTGVGWDQVYGMVHSHTAATYTPQQPDSRLFPTSNNSAPDQQGDWAAYDARVDLMINALQSLGRSDLEIETRHLQFRQYILGATGGIGTNFYELHGYDRDDRDRVTVGQNVSLNLGLCGA